MVVACAALAAVGCTEKEIVSYVPPSVPIAIHNVEGLPSPVTFDRVRVSLCGLDWQVIGTFEANFADGKATLVLPGWIETEKLCKVARDAPNDYQGYWPAEEVSDRNARVAGFEGNNIIAYSGENPVGRLYLTDWSGNPQDTDDRYYICFLYSDRPVTLSGYNLVREGQPHSFRYEASFTAGWNVYANVSYPVTGIGQSSPPSLCTTDIPENISLRWRFEKW